MPYRSGAAVSVAVLLCALIVAVPLAAFIGLVTAYERAGAIVPGVFVGSASVGRLTPDAAARHLTAAFPNDAVLTIHIAGETYPLPLTDMGVALDVAGTVEAARQVGRRGTWPQRLGETVRVAAAGVDVGPRWTVDTPRFDAAMEGLARRFSQPPQNARLHGSKGEPVTVTPHTVAVSLTPEQWGRLVRQALEAGANRFVVDRRYVETPAVTTQLLRAWGVNELLATFETVFSPAEVNRTTNIVLAAEALDGAVVPPYATLSFNEIVGPRTAARGYKPAKVIIAGEFVDDYGGGVCQVSTTLYNAAMKSGMDVLERVPHSLPVSYVPPGRDAAVVYGLADLKVRNPYSRPLVVQTRVTGRRIAVDIFGPGGEKRASR